MNKVISTDPHCFICLVGPSGSGKTALIHKMLTSKTMFHPDFHHVVYFYQHYQPLYTTMQEELASKITFIQGIDWSFIEQLPSTHVTALGEKKTTRYLLIFDDVCQHAAKKVEFLNLATSGRHRNLHVMLVKHNLYHQSKFSKTIDLNTAQIILFKSPRDQDQIGYLGRQLGNRKFLLATYKDITSNPFGHLLIDLDPRCNELLRYCSSITRETIFYTDLSSSNNTTRLESPGLFSSGSRRRSCFELSDDQSKRVYTAAVSNI